MRSRALRVLVLLLLATATIVAGCGGATLRQVVAAEAVTLLSGRTVIDVRTPAEFDTGHISGAVNIDAEAASFQDRIATLDKQGAYLVYCRSGRRSEIAAKAMIDAGFTDVVDAGAMDGLVAAGARTQ